MLPTAVSGVGGRGGVAGAATSRWGTREASFTMGWRGAPGDGGQNGRTSGAGSGERSEREVSGAAGPYLDTRYPDICIYP